MPQAADLPSDIDALRRIVLERSAKLEVAEALLISQKLELEKLRFEIAYLKRMKYGRSSEQQGADHRPNGDEPAYLSPQIRAHRL